ncbi:MAG TPA: hypothetical protein GXX72_01340 [Clostridiaceae bacterium]|nr:hypothetical protein [Clostridiaceae bacterium]
MAMSENYRNAIANHGGSLIKYIGLVNASGVEISGGGYARKAVTWTAASGGTIRPNADLVFDVPAGATVAGWRGFSAATTGTNYGGEDLTAETFAGAGQYKLLAANTGILHNNA